MNSNILKTHSRPIKDVKFSSQSTKLFTGSIDRQIIIWDTERLKMMGLLPQKAAVSNFCITKDSKYLICGDLLGSLSIWDLNTYELINEFEGDMRNTIKNIDLSNNNQKALITISGRQKQSGSHLEIYDVYDLFNCESASKLKSSRENFIESSISRFNKARFLENDHSIVCGLENGIIQKFEMETNLLINSVHLHEDSILDIDISSNQESILTCSKDGKALLLDSQNLEIIKSYFPENPRRNLNSGKFSPLYMSGYENRNIYDAIIGGGQDSSKVTTTHTNQGGFDILFYNFHNETEKEVESLESHFGPVNVVAYSDNGRLIASGGEDTLVNLTVLNMNHD